MRIAKDGIRSIVRVGFDGCVFKTFRGTDADKRFANEIRVLKVLEERGCDYVPQLLDSDEATLTITTTNCGKPVESISKLKCEQLFAELKEDFGVVHDDPFDRNVTYHARMGRFCIIDFELAEILEWNGTAPPGTDSELLLSWFGMTVEGVRKKGNEDALAAFAAYRKAGTTGLWQFVPMAMTLAGLLGFVLLKGPNATAAFILFAIGVALVALASTKASAQTT